MKLEVETCGGMERRFTLTVSMREIEAVRWKASGEGARHAAFACGSVETIDDMPVSSTLVELAALAAQIEALEVYASDTRKKLNL